MADGIRHNPPAIADGVKCVLTNTRDETWTQRCMAELFAKATELQLEPRRWELGFFCLRDLVRVRDPLMRHKNRFSRPETVWGGEIIVVTFQDHVELVAWDAANQVHHVFVAKGHA